MGRAYVCCLQIIVKQTCVTNTQVKAKNTARLRSAPPHPSSLSGIPALLWLAPVHAAYIVCFGLAVFEIHINGIMACIVLSFVTQKHDCEIQANRCV